MKELEITHEQLIYLGILVGTDYNVGGIKGIGQKKALKIIKEFKTPEKIFSQFEDLTFDWKEIFDMFHKPNVKKNVEILFPKMNEDKIREILLKHDFSKQSLLRTLSFNHFQFLYLFLNSFF